MSRNKNDIQVVLIDDDQYQLNVLTQQLAANGIRNITTCTNGLEAIDQLANKSFYDALILLDLNMPIMDGVAFISLLKDTPFTGSILLISSANERIQNATVRMTSSYGLSVLGQIQKPITTEQLKKYLDIYSNGAPRVKIKKRQIVYTEDRLRQALETGELITEYQPQVNVKNGEFIGVEALVRWAHPDDGLIQPDQFIPLAEDSNLIDEIFHYVLDQAFTDWSLFRKNGLDITLSINISIANLNSTNIIYLIESTLKEAGIPPDKLILEVTESQLIKEYPLVLNILTSLRLRGVNLSIDDFGTGHSTIAQLQDIPFNELKLDKSFVHNAFKDKTIFGIFSGSMQLAINLDIDVKAEGVENIHDWIFLSNSSCHIAQGFFISKAMPAHFLTAWSEEWLERFPTINN